MKNTENLVVQDCVILAQEAAFLQTDASESGGRRSEKNVGGLQRGQNYLVDPTGF